MKAGGIRFQPGEGPSKGLLRDYEPSCQPSFEALDSPLAPVAAVSAVSGCCPLLIGLLRSGQGPAAGDFNE